MEEFAFELFAPCPYKEKMKRKTLHKLSKLFKLKMLHRSGEFKLLSKKRFDTLDYFKDEEYSVEAMVNALDSYIHRHQEVALWQIYKKSSGKDLFFLFLYSSRLEQFNDSFYLLRRFVRSFLVNSWKGRFDKKSEALSYEHFLKIKKFKVKGFKTELVFAPKNYGYCQSSRKEKPFWLDAHTGIILKNKRGSICISYWIGSDNIMRVNQIQTSKKDKSHHLLGSAWRTQLLNYLKEDFNLVLAKGDYVKHLILQGYTGKDSDKRPTEETLLRVSKKYDELIHTDFNENYGNLIEF